MYDKYKIDLNNYAKEKISSGFYGTYSNFGGYSVSVPYYYNVEGCGNTMSNEKMAECIANDLSVNEFSGNFIVVEVLYDKLNSEVKYVVV